MTNEYQPPQLRTPSVWRVLAGMVMEFCGDVWNYCGKWSGSLWRYPRGCWVSVQWDYHGSVPMRGNEQEREIKSLRFQVENRSRFPVVVVEAGWVYRGKNRQRPELMVPLLGEAVGDPIRQEVAAKDSQQLTLSARLVYKRHPKNWEELVGADELVRNYRSPWVAYVRLENGRIFRSYEVFGVGPVYVP